MGGSKEMMWDIMSSCAPYISVYLHDEFTSNRKYFLHLNVQTSLSNEIHEQQGKASPYFNVHPRLGQMKLSQ